MKTILVPTDFSTTADSAILYAFELAESFDASIILYHAFIPFESGFYSLDQSKKENLETENSLVKRLSNIKDNISKTYKSISVAIHVDRGPSSIRLVEFCEKKSIDLIIMGTTGASGIKEAVIGSFTADTMTKATCPVLAIPNNYKFKIPKKITFASDYHANDILAIKYLAELSRSFETKICVLHIDNGEHSPESEEKQFEIFKQELECQCDDVPLLFQHIAAPDITNAIVKIVLSDNTDMLAISPIKREGFWDRLMNKSVTKAIAHHIHIPLLSIPVKKH